MSTNKDFMYTRSKDGKVEAINPCNYTIKEINSNLVGILISPNYYCFITIIIFPQFGGNKAI